MEALTAILPIIIYFLLIILLIVVIILGVKIIITLDKVNEIVNDVREKVEALNGIFKVVNMVSDKVNYLSTRVIDTVISGLNKIFGLKNERDDDYYE